MSRKPVKFPKPVEVEANPQKPSGIDPSAAVDSNAAAKKNGAMKLKQDHIAVMDTLINAHDNASRVLQEARARLNAYCDQVATLVGVDPKDFELNWDLKAFIPKPKDK